MRGTERRDVWEHLGTVCRQPFSQQTDTCTLMVEICFICDQELHKYKDNPGCQHSWSSPHFLIQKALMIFESLQDCSPLLPFPVKGTSKVSRREPLSPVCLVCTEGSFQPPEVISTCRMWLWTDWGRAAPSHCVENLAKGNFHTQLSFQSVCDLRHAEKTES